MPDLYATKDSNGDRAIWNDRPKWSKRDKGFRMSRGLVSNPTCVYEIAADWTKDPGDTPLLNRIFPIGILPGACHKVTELIGEEKHVERHTGSATTSAPAKGNAFFTVDSVGDLAGKT